MDVPSIVRMSEDYGKRSTLWLLVALTTCALVNFAFVAFLVSAGERRDRAIEASGLQLTPALLKPTGNDSIYPMVMAYVRQLQRGDMYWVFLAKGVKFQYPPSSLLIMKLLPQEVTIPVFLDLWALQTKLSLSAVLITIMCAAGLWLKLITSYRNRPIRWSKTNALIAIVLIGILGGTYYPLIKGHNLGQIQVYLGALCAVALLLQEFKLNDLSGVCIGLCCLVKPQFAVLILWALLRRQKDFLWGFGAVLALGLCLSIIEFGLNNHIQYLEVLQYMSRRGETYGPNQSVNGLLNRLLENGSAIDFQPYAFAPYHPVVYFATAASSVLILALALFLPAAEGLRGRSLDLAVVISAATIASPIAWEHHYGVFFPIFSIALVAAVQSRRSSLLLLVSYGLMANELLRPKLVFADRWTGILGSHIFFGALLLFGFLLTARFRGTKPNLPPVSPLNTQLTH